MTIQPTHVHPISPESMLDIIFTTVNKRAKALDDKAVREKNNWSYDEWMARREEVSAMLNYLRSMW